MGFTLEKRVGFEPTTSEDILEISPVIGRTVFEALAAEAETQVPVIEGMDVVRMPVTRLPDGQTVPDN